MKADGFRRIILLIAVWLEFCFFPVAAQEAIESWQFHFGTSGKTSGFATRNNDGWVFPLAENIEIFAGFPKSGSGWPVEANWLLLHFRFQKGLPEGLRLRLFSQDNDYLWREMFLTVFPDDDGRWTARIPLADHPATVAWKPYGHRRPWTPLTSRNLLLFGFVFQADSLADYRGKAAFSAEFSEDSTADGTPDFYDFRYPAAVTELGHRQEFSFRLATWPHFPFDSEKCDIRARITTPAGQTEEIRGFYYEDFLYDPQEWDKTKCLRPGGEPRYCFRYYPREAGQYAAELSAVIDGRPVTLPAVAFEAVAGSRKPFPFVMRQPLDIHFLQYDDGREFFGIGLNFRSPYDVRYAQIVPYSSWPDMGMAACDYFFPKLAAAGIDVLEVWMSSWWLALEWTEGEPGFHGVGHYNQYRAWMFDHVLQLAEDYGIRLLVPLNNHGKFSETSDQEWARNPYNVANGGFLAQCGDYYSDERAKQAFKRTADYILARWSASPNILGWKLFTEIDLTGPSTNFYRQPCVAAWHDEMSSYLHQHDVWQHPVTTHWMVGYVRINDEIARIPGLDFLTTDIYYNLGQGTRGLVDMMRDGWKRAESWQKPLVITEYGGSSMGDTMQNLTNQIEIGLWAGFFYRLPITPFFWWFSIVEEKDLFNYYRVLADFAGGERRQKMELRMEILEAPERKLQVMELQGADRLLFWLYDENYYLVPGENPPAALQEGVELSFDSPEQPGKYQVEFWNPATGKLQDEAEIEAVPGQKLHLALPPFRKSFAVKIRLKEQAGD